MKKCEIKYEIYVNFVKTQIISSCHLLHNNDLDRAKDYVNFTQAMFKFLQNHNISSTADQPAASFFSAYKDHLDDDTARLYIGSDVSLALSKILIDKIPAFFASKQLVDFNPLLKEKSGCFKDFFKTFCVSNDEFSCDGRNLM